MTRTGRGLVTLDHMDKINEIGHRYRKWLKREHQKEFDRFLEKAKAELVSLFNGDQEKAEREVSKQIKHFFERKQTLLAEEQDCFLSGVEDLNAFLKLLQTLDKNVCKMMSNIDRNMLDMDADIYSPVKKLEKRGLKFINREFLEPIHDAFGQMNNVQELIDSSKKLITVTTAVIASAKSCDEANKMLHFQYWLEHKIKFYQELKIEIERMKKLKDLPDIQDSSILDEENINKFYGIIFPSDSVHRKGRKVLVSDLSIKNFRVYFEKALPYHEEFRALSMDEQERVIHELELKHLKAQADRCKQDIEARLAVARFSDYPKESVAGLLDNEMKKVLNDIYKRPKLDAKDEEDKKIINCDERIKADLQAAAVVQRKKLAARILTMIGVGLVTAFIAATIAAAFVSVPGLLFVGLAAGAAVCFLAANIVKEDQNDKNLVEKGFRHFARKVHLLFHPEKKREYYAKKLSAPDPLKQMKINRQVTQRALNRYINKLKNYDKEGDIFNEIKEDLGKDKIEGIKGSAVLRVNNALNGECITSKPEIGASKKYAGLRRLISGCQSLERSVSEAVDFLRPDDVNRSADEISKCAIELAKNDKVTEALGVAGRVSAIKFKKLLSRVVSVAAFVASSGYKCARAQTILQFDVWLKRQLLLRYKLQKESSKIESYLKHLSGKKELIDANSYYQSFFPEGKVLDSQSVKQDVLDLSIKKFRKVLAEKLADDESFLKLKDEDQVYVIASLEHKFINDKIERSEKDMLARANVEMSTRSQKYRNQLASHIEENYLGYDKNGFKNNLDAVLKLPSASNEDRERNAVIKAQLKQALNVERSKVIARSFLLIAAGLSLAVLIAGFAAAPISVIVGLTVGALACLIVAKAVRPQDGIRETIKKGFGHLSEKLFNQFTLWDSKSEMRKKPELGLATASGPDIDQTANMDEGSKPGH